MRNEDFTDISFYVVAHADDWQLFMQPNAYNHVVSDATKVVFIITTAGDAGAGETFWAAREEGIRSSLRFCMASCGVLVESSGQREFNNHMVSYWSANNTTCYFLRLPDGNLDGSGFPQNHYQSLWRLKSAHITTIMAIDSSAEYSGWSDFHTTLQTIIESESSQIAGIGINYLNPDPGTNPDDHNDHIATGQAVQEMTIVASLQQTLFVGYSVSNSGENLSPADLFWKAGMFAAYEKAVYDYSGYSTLKESIPTYVRWCLSGPSFITVGP